LVTLFFPFRLTVIPGGAEKNLALKTAYGPIPNYIDGENQPFPPLSTKPATFKTEIKVEIKQPPEEEEVSVVEEEEEVSVVEEDEVSVVEEDKEEDDEKEVNVVVEKEEVSIVVDDIGYVNITFVTGVF